MQLDFAAVATAKFRCLSRGVERAVFFTLQPVEPKHIATTLELLSPASSGSDTTTTGSV
jgi:hypothetical protein